MFGCYTVCTSLKKNDMITHLPRYRQDLFELKQLWQTHSNHHEPSNKFSDFCGWVSKDLSHIRNLAPSTFLRFEVGDGDAGSMANQSAQ